MIHFIFRVKVVRAGLFFLTLLFLTFGCRAESKNVDTQGEELRGESSRSATTIRQEDGQKVQDLTEPNLETDAAGVKMPTTEQKANRTNSTEGSAVGADADVVSVRAVHTPDDSWTFHVTVRHPDTGWDDYANGWDVITPDGLVLKRDPDDLFTRLLLHPHVDEQPYTRSQSGLFMPEGTNQVIVRAHDLVNGFGGQSITVDLTASSGPGFKVERR